MRNIVGWAHSSVEGLTCRVEVCLAISRLQLEVYFGVFLEFMLSSLLLMDFVEGKVKAQIQVGC